MKIEIIRKEDNKIFLVHKYTLGGTGEQNIWCWDWHGHHIIGVDCEWNITYTKE
jgi:hypothetical protein